MNTITLHMENRADNTAVSNYFIDTLMPQANGEFVKIYLYLLRCVSAGHISLSVSEMADLFNQTEADILRGLRYWDKMNALRLNFFDIRRSDRDKKIKTKTHKEEKESKTMEKTLKVEGMMCPHCEAAVKST